jgi:hypothetical protein
MCDSGVLFLCVQYTTVQIVDLQMKTSRPQKWEVQIRPVLYGSSNVFGRECIRFLDLILVNQSHHQDANFYSIDGYLL